MEERELLSLIATGEGPLLEFKRNGTTHLGREICAFANSLGGRILIGVDDAGNIHPVQKLNRLQSEVQSIARHLEPPLLVECGKVGSGLKRIREMCAGYPCALPVIEADREWYKILFYRPGAKETLEVRLMGVVSGEMSRQEIQSLLGLKDDEHFRKTYLLPAPRAGLIEMTIPDKPRSSKQKYRLTPRGRSQLIRPHCCA